MQSFHRSDRVGSAMQRALSELLPKLKQPPPGIVTIQEARVSRDLSHAKIYFTVLGADVEEVMENLQFNAGHLRHMLAKHVKLRQIPELHFVHDVSIEEGNRLEKLIDDAVAEDRAHHADGQTEEN